MLIGQKICLGPLLQEDGPRLFNWFNTLVLAHANGPYRPMDQTQFNTWFVDKDPSRVVFAIRSKVDAKLLGYVQLIGIQPVHRCAELGILIGDAPDRSQGFGQEAVTMALAFAWRDLNLQRVSLSVVGDNPRAIHVYEKIGFQYEGLLRRAAYVNGEFRDVTLMAILRPTRN